MKKLWIALTILGIIMFILCAGLSASIYRWQMLQASRNETFSYGSAFALMFSILLAFAGVVIALFAGYKLLKGD
jgi:Kef-type K+ transport system membrane component KefB